MRKITIIGACNIATHLALELVKKECSISQVFSKTKKSAQELAKKIDPANPDQNLVEEFQKRAMGMKSTGNPGVTSWWTTEAYFPGSVRKWPRNG